MHTSRVQSRVSNPNQVCMWPAAAPTHLADFNQHHTCAPVANVFHTTVPTRYSAMAICHTCAREPRMCQQKQQRHP